MKRTNLAKKLTAMVMTGAMVMSMGMTTFAVEPLIPITDDGITVTKEINRGEDVLYPNTSFEFSVTPVGTPNVEITDTTKLAESTVYGGVQGGAYFATDAEKITVTPDTTGELTTKIKLDASVFTKPGIFRYEVREISSNYDGMTYDATHYYLDLYVVNNGESKKIEGVVASKWDEEKEAYVMSTLTFNNTYATNDLKVTKIITGNQADMSATFDFTITVKGATGEKYNTNYPVESGDPGETVVLEAGNSSKIKLGNNQSIEIYGLSASDTFTIVEDKANEDGYTTTYELDGASKQASELVDVPEGTAKKDVKVTNTKEITTPTGIAMTFAPYALMVAFAGVFAVMFLRKKREDF